MTSYYNVHTELPGPGPGVGAALDPAVSSHQQTYHEPGPVQSVRTKQGFQYILEWLVDIGQNKAGGRAVWTWESHLSAQHNKHYV